VLTSEGKDRFHCHCQFQK